MQQQLLSIRRGVNNISALVELEITIDEACSKKQFRLGRFLVVMRRVLAHYEVAIMDMCSGFEQIGIPEIGLFLAKVYYQMLELIRRLLKNMQPLATVQDYYEDDELLQPTADQTRGDEEEQRVHHDYVAEVYAQIERSKFLMRDLDRIIELEPKKYPAVEKLEQDVDKNREKALNTTYSSAANLLSESLATLTSHNKYTKNYCNFTQNHIRTESFIMEYLETYSASSSWTAEERVNKLALLADRVHRFIDDLKQRRAGPAETRIAKDTSTQTAMEHRSEESYLSFKTQKGVIFDDWQDEMKNNRIVIELLKADVNRLEQQLKNSTNQMDHLAAEKTILTQNIATLNSNLSTLKTEKSILSKKGKNVSVKVSERSSGAESKRASVDKTSEADTKNADSTKRIEAQSEASDISAKDLVANIRSTRSKRFALTTKIDLEERQLVQLEELKEEPVKIQEAASPPQSSSVQTARYDRSEKFLEKETKLFLDLQVISVQIAPIRRKTSRAVKMVDKGVECINPAAEVGMVRRSSTPSVAMVKKEFSFRETMDERKPMIHKIKSGKPLTATPASSIQAANPDQQKIMSSPKERSSQPTVRNIIRTTIRRPSPTDLFIETAATAKDTRPLLQRPSHQLCQTEKEDIATVELTENFPDRLDTFENSSSKSKFFTMMTARREDSRPSNERKSMLTLLRLDYTTDNYELFGGEEQARNMEGLHTSEMTRPPSRASVVHEFKSKRRVGLCETELQPLVSSGLELSVLIRNVSVGNGAEDELIHELYEHLQRLRKLQPANYLSIRNSLRYPFSFVKFASEPVWKEQGKQDQQFTLVELRRIMKRLYRLHAKCAPAGSSCEHLQRFYSKIGFKLGL